MGTRTLGLGTPIVSSKRQGFNLHTGNPTSACSIIIALVSPAWHFPISGTRGKWEIARVTFLLSSYTAAASLHAYSLGLIPPPKDIPVILAGGLPGVVGYVIRVFKQGTYLPTYLSTPSPS